jgi:DNA polymerase-2
MNEQSGWLLDVYVDQEAGLVLWLLTDDDQRLHLRMDFPVTFYTSGDFQLLRQAWAYLKDKDVKLERMRRHDLFSGECDVMSVAIANPIQLSKLYRDLSQRFPSLEYYDADIPTSLRLIARTNTHMLGRCRVYLDGEWIQRIEPLSSPWEIDPVPLPLRIMTLSPDVDPSMCTPQSLKVQCGRDHYSAPLKPTRPFLIGLLADLKRYDPDVILTDYGDTWLFPQLKIWSEEYGVSFNPNRDKKQEILIRRADSYFAYGQVIYRGAQAHLFGRWHIDRRNAMSYGEYGLEGAMEQARVTGLGVQEMARKSPGAGITAMQMLTALQNGVLVPMQKRQAEDTKTLIELIRADRGGMIYQPLIGLHHHVAQIDFSSMYPAIMVKHNISPETVGKENAPEGLIPRTLRPLLEKRLMLKNILLDLNPNDCRVNLLKKRAAALKWLLVVCFGYLGYKNARFGKIESHEAVTSMSRELLLQAKEVAEDMGFEILHMYVDCLFVQKSGAVYISHFTDLLENIAEQTGLSITLDGIYKWLVFPPSKRDARVPVPNRYFGAFQNDEIKVRGLALRRHDTPKFVADTQMGILKVLAKSDDPREKEYEVQEYMKKQIGLLRGSRIPMEDLIVTQTLSRPVEAYRVSSPTARAAIQLEAQGKIIQPGMRIRYVHVYDRDGIHAWDIGNIQRKMVNVKQYIHLLKRAEGEVFDVFEKPMQNASFAFRPVQA